MCLYVSENVHMSPVPPETRRGHRIPLGWAGKWIVILSMSRSTPNLWALSPSRIGEDSHETKWHLWCVRSCGAEMFTISHYCFDLSFLQRKHLLDLFESKTRHHIRKRFPWKSVRKRSSWGGWWSRCGKAGQCLSLRGWSRQLPHSCLKLRASGIA